MSTLAIKQFTPEIPSSGLERLNRQKGATLEAEKQRLRKATKEFEAFFSHYLLKTMRKTIPEDPLGKGLSMGEGSGREIYTDLFDMELSRHISGSSRGSLGDILYRSMEPLIEAEFAGDSDLPPTLNPLRPDVNRSMPLGQDALSLPGRAGQMQALDGVSRRSPAVRRDLPDDDISDRYGRDIRRAARRHELSPALVHSVIKAESGGDPLAVSSAGAKGLMQLIDSTAQALGVKDSFDPRQNIEAGTKYLKHLLDRFGDTRLAVAAYNAGPANVERYGGMPPFPETENYVQRVMDNVKTMRSESHPSPKAGSDKDR
ncbi:MAG: transglycosylase SLT domain-containing protein [bacterium]